MSEFRRRLMVAGMEEIGYDYITDGLILHLDGKWNGGMGIHLSTTDTWVDLSPAGNDAQSINGTMISFAKDYGIFTSADGFLSYIGLGAGESLSIEMWKKRTFGNRYCVGNWGFKLNGTTTMSVASGDTYLQYYGASNFNTGKHLGLRYTFTYDKDSQTVKTYSDGIVTATYSMTLPTAANRATPVFAINWKLDSNVSYNGGQLYMVRIYNRALTDEEVLHNYNTDNKRLSR